MKYVLYSTDWKKLVKELTITFENNEIKFKGNKFFINELKNNGIFSKTELKKVFPKDGKIFIDALVYRYKNCSRMIIAKEE